MRGTPITRPYTVARLLNRLRGLSLLLLLMLTCGGPLGGVCRAASAEGIQQSGSTTRMLIELLEQKGVLSAREAERFIDHLSREIEATRPVVRIVPEAEAEDLLQQAAGEITDKLNQELSRIQDDTDRAMDSAVTRTRLLERRHDLLEQKVTEDHNQKLQASSWAQRIRFGGDIRLRHHSDMLDERNALFLDPQNPTEFINSQQDRHRQRARIRLDAKAKVLDPREINVGKVEVGLRLATGSEEDPVSTNETAGDYLNRDTLTLERYYLTWRFVPEMYVLGGRLPEVALTAGRMANPWFATDLIWDSDLNFEGLTIGLNSDTQDTGDATIFLTAGMFAIQEEEWSSHDKWLTAGQIGIKHRPRHDLSYTLGFAYYDYHNIEGRPNPLNKTFNNFTAPEFQQKGNTLFDIDPSSDIRTALASDYNLLNLTAKLDYTGFIPKHVILEGDFVKNLGFDRQEVAALTGNADQNEETDGYLLGVTVGYPETRKFGDWNVFLRYKYLRADAVLDAFTDSDFHLGGTNAKGWTLGAEYGLYSNLWLSTKWITSDEIQGPPLAVDTFQIDLNAKF